MAHDIVQFLRRKDYKFLKDIGQGGLGKTILLKDEIIDEDFVYKKYAPIFQEHIDLYFQNFVDEIKILHKLHHQNIVRIFNYYLYPSQKTGYILMDYIDGTDMHQFLHNQPEKINDIFCQTIEGFRYLEKINILHRDIRPQNILISNEGIVKIIDFGFGKKINFDDTFDKSITLNWYYSIPDEFQNKIYDFKTEIYFIGKLFENLLTEVGTETFAYNSILQSMLEKYDNRINSFFEISRRITEGHSLLISFNFFEKNSYKAFADVLQKCFSTINKSSSYVTDIPEIIKSLDEIHQNSILEDSVIDINNLTTTFVSGMFHYKPKATFSIAILASFIDLLKNNPKEKQKIIMNHIWKRLDAIDRYDDSDDLPF